MEATRRGVLATGLAAPSLARAAAGPAGMSTIDADLAHYVALGNKASGGAGDTAAGAWMEARLKALSFTVERQLFQAPSLETEAAELLCGGTTLPCRPLALTRTTPAQGVSGPLRLLEPMATPGDLAGAVVLIPLPFARWSSAKVEAIQAPVRQAFAAGAVGVVLVTHGPTGEVIALNVEAAGPMFDGPVALMAPQSAGEALKVLDRPCRLTLTGRSGQRPAFNLMGRLERGKGRWLVVSTPRSGWTACAGERGPGVAVWLALAEWAAGADLPANLAFVCNSGHEYENLGAARMLEAIAPPPNETAFWLHLGANVAARDWHELGGRLAPLPSADPQRVLMASAPLLDAARKAFAGQPGLEAPYPAGAGAVGELSHIIAAGYPRVAGVFGVHRYHHVDGDDDRCLAPGPTAAALEGFKHLIAAALA